MKKGEQTRQRIIARAASLLNRRGYEGSSMLDVMEATGLEKGGIYRHFSSKEELAAEAFDYAWQQAWETRSHDLDDTPNTVDRLKRLIANFVERRPSVPGGCPLLNTAVDADNGNPVLRDRARMALKQWQARLHSIAEEGMRKGEIRSKLDVTRLANLVIAFLEGALMISRLERTDRALRDAQSHLDDYLEYAVRNPSKGR